MDTPEVIASQIAYYRARTSEYDDWFERRGEFRINQDHYDRWQADADALRAWLSADPPTGHVLEVAAGSGNWTGELLKTADRVTAVDSSSEMLAVLGSKHEGVDQIVADIFIWEPSQRYDNVFCGFWISHVPSTLWEAFWSLIDRALRPEGRVWFIDNAHPERSVTHGPSHWQVTAKLRQIADADNEVQQRTLRDGSQWAMVKRYWWPDELEAQLEQLGWQAQVDNTDWAFIYGVAHRSHQTT